MQESGSGTGVSTAPFFGSAEGDSLHSEDYNCSDSREPGDEKESEDPQSSASPASS